MRGFFWTLLTAGLLQKSLLILMSSISVATGLADSKHIILSVLMLTQRAMFRVICELMRIKLSVAFIIRMNKKDYFELSCL